ncbi:serine hydrolase domain-containing protein [Kribbella italica]|uniref:CubicO group peptidase (Beta-lactamase class C family) n=1 Tax=Kribbella italica TaxID=1540520 RepID=A0A7W9MYK4_9ACTN|nr:serine hydrolase domain-containing protein [Kribbella italica]MBB5841246.1 CubicO group peptidase (beta-lactamase class C family) [Kribbella italica]
MTVFRSVVDSVEKLVLAGEVPGAVVGVADGERQWIHAAGLDRPGGDALRPDAVFRISSMTKPLTAALTLRLVDDGVLALDDSIHRWLPELSGQRVLRQLDGPLDDTVPADKAPTVEDLLLMRLGFGFAFEVDSPPIAEKAFAAGLGMGPPTPSSIPHAPDEWVRRFAELPLMEQPGRHWRYEFSYAVLGVLLARAAGAALPTLFDERIFTPLGMNDTGFAVPAHARDRLIPCFTDGTAVFDDVPDSDWLAAPAFPHAGGGLVSTAADYLTFATSLSTGHQSLGDTQAVDRLTAEQRSGPSAQIFLDGEGWGYGVQVRSAGPGIPARYGWGGGLGTLWYAYPDHGISAVLMTQHLPPSPATVAALADPLDAALST